MHRASTLLDYAKYAIQGADDVACGEPQSKLTVLIGAVFPKVLRRNCPSRSSRYLNCLITQLPQPSGTSMT